MEKIPTIFDRDWDGNRGVIPRLVVDVNKFPGATTTEKLDGTNVRVTVRSEEAVRLEKRRNPNKIQKQKGIEEPWYIDAAWDYGMKTAGSKEDQYLVEALVATDLSGVPDGEWSAEAVGPKIQGNPLGLDNHRLFFFTPALPERLLVPTLGDVPKIHEAPSQSSSEAVVEWWFNALHDYLSGTHSRVGQAGIEGIVWVRSGSGNYVGKLKLKDFK